MRSEQIIANTEKAKGGNTYEKELYYKIRRDDKLKIKSVRNGKKFSYHKKTPIEEIADMVTYPIKKAQVEKLVDAYLKNNKGKPIRDEKSYYKRADITFMTQYKYITEGKLQDIRIIIDTTTSARTDRIKAKAQDSLVYRQFDSSYVYLIVLPNDEYFTDKGYANPDKEVKLCKNEVYGNNFCDLYKGEGVDLILQEKDLMNFLNYIGKRKEKDIKKLIEQWEKTYFKDMYAKRIAEKEDIRREYIEKVMESVTKKFETKKDA